MSKHFRRWNIDQTLLLPPNVRDFVPKDHVSRFIVGLVREGLDLKAIMCSYVSGLGQPPFDPRMMVSLFSPEPRPACCPGPGLIFASRGSCARLGACRCRLAQCWAITRVRRRSERPALARAGRIWGDRHGRRRPILVSVT